MRAIEATYRSIAEHAAIMDTNARRQSVLQPPRDGGSGNPETFTNLAVCEPNYLCRQFRNRLVDNCYEFLRTTTHGFRRVFSTEANEHGWDEDWVERQLAHDERDRVRAANNAAQYLPQRRKMLQWWADYLDELKATEQEARGFTSIRHILTCSSKSYTYLGSVE